MAVKIKLKRLGKIRAPYYRIVVADARTKRDGRAIEEIGKYHPKAEPSFIEVNSERALHWLSVGAQPTDPVRKLLEITGDWQKYKGLPGTEGTLRTAEPKTDRKVVFAEALQETLEAGGVTSKGKSRGKAGDSAPAKGGRGAKPDSAKSESPKADSAKSESPKADSAKSESAKADSAKSGSAKSESPKAESPKAEPAKAEPAKAEPAKAESDSAKGDKATADAEATAQASDSASSEG